MAKKETKTNKKENNKNKKSFAKGFKAELKKVVWPTPKQLVNNTIAVITIVLITAAIVFILDLVFETINTQGIDKIKGAVTSANETTENASQEATDDANVSTEETETTSEESQQDVQEDVTEGQEVDTQVDATSESVEE